MVTACLAFSTELPDFCKALAISEGPVGFHGFSFYLITVLVDQAETGRGWHWELGAGLLVLPHLSIPEGPAWEEP